MTKIRVLKPILVAGAHREPGDVVEVPAHEARYLVGRGLAEPAKAQAKGKAKKQ